MNDRLAIDVGSLHASLFFFRISVPRSSQEQT